jgi:hypothetical protein
VPSPIICFGQQPCGIFPRRFLYAKIMTARRLQSELGGEIVFFCHDADHDPRETMTILRDRRSGQEQRINFSFANKLQREFSPLFAKRIVPDWQANTARQLPNLVPQSCVDAFKAVQAENVADFCLEMYRQLGLLDGLRLERSGDPQFRRRACAVDDFFVDVSTKASWCARASAPRHFYCTKAAVPTSSYRSRNSMPRRSVQPATPVCAGCNRLCNAHTTSPERVRSII